MSRLSSTDAAPTPPLRILVAEDSLVQQKLTVHLLLSAGHRVTIAKNGREAIAAYEAAAFDLILMDVEMPEMDGLAATRAIRQQEKGSKSRIPIVGLTTIPDPERCLQAGMDGYVKKPINPAELAAAIGFSEKRPPEQVVAKRILLADDDPMTVESLRHALEHEGHSVLVATDGNQALEMAEKYNPDLVILDVIMPSRSGLSVLAKLQATRLADTPVVMISGINGGQKTAAQRLGANDYLRKPFPPVRLLETIDRLLAV